MCEGDGERRTENGGRRTKDEIGAAAQGVAKRVGLWLGARGGRMTESPDGTCGSAVGINVDPGG